MDILSIICGIIVMILVVILFAGISALIYPAMLALVILGLFYKQGQCCMYGILLPLMIVLIGMLCYVPFLPDDNTIDKRIQYEHYTDTYNNIESRKDPLYTYEEYWNIYEDK